MKVLEQIVELDKKLVSWLQNCNTLEFFGSAILASLIVLATMYLIAYAIVLLVGGQ